MKVMLYTGLHSCKFGTLLFFALLSYGYGYGYAGWTAGSGSNSWPLIYVTSWVGDRTKLRLP